MGSAAVLSQPSSARTAFTTHDPPPNGPPNWRHDPVVCNGWYGRARQGGARRGPKDAVHSVGCPGAGDAQEAAGAPGPEGGRDPRIGGLRYEEVPRLGRWRHRPAHRDL